MLSYGDLKQYFQEAFYLLLLLIGALFFYVGFKALNNILKNHVYNELDKIDEMNDEYIKNFLIKISDINNNRKDQNITDISAVLDVLQRQREAIEKIALKMFDFKSIFVFVSTSILPIVTSLLKNMFVTKQEEFISLIYNSSIYYNITEEFIQLKQIIF